MKREWIGFYDKNGKKIYEGDTVLSFRKKDGYTSKKIPKQISVVYRVKWSDIEPKYYFAEVAAVKEHSELDFSYHYNLLPYFHAHYKGLFWKDSNGVEQNPWHWNDIKHIKGEKKYKALYEVELIDSQKLKEIL